MSICVCDATVHCLAALPAPLSGPKGKTLITTQHPRGQREGNLLTLLPASVSLSSTGYRAMRPHLCQIRARSGPDPSLCLLQCHSKPQHTTAQGGTKSQDSTSSLHSQPPLASAPLSEGPRSTPLPAPIYGPKARYIYLRPQTETHQQETNPVNHP